MISVQATACTENQWFPYPRYLTLNQTSFRVGEIAVRTTRTDRIVFCVSDCQRGLSVTGVWCLDMIMAVPSRSNGNSS